tara:strand:- start:23211 stop:24551 length:1341 start_codon:yes stop_codon:yes gene_type:complete
MDLLELSNKGKGNLIGDNAFPSGISIDTRTLSKGNLFIPLKGENFDGHDFINQAILKGASSIVSSKLLKIDIPYILVDDSFEFIHRVSKKNRKEFKGIVIAITGSNGKTTTKEMLYSTLSFENICHKTYDNKNNLIGLPLSLLGLNNEAKYSVLELGTSFLGEIELLTSIADPDISLITNVSESHLEGLSNVDSVAKEKGEILKFQGSNGIAILPRDSDYFDYWRTISNAKRIVSFGEHLESDIQLKNVSIDFAKRITKFTTSILNKNLTFEINGIGKHNAINAIAALATGFALDMPLEDFKKPLKNISFPLGRMTIYKGFNGSYLIDDSYNSNPKSMKTALDTLSINESLRKIIAVGGMKELGEQSELLHNEILDYAQGKVDQFLCIGEEWENVKKKENKNFKIFRSQTDLIKYLKEILDKDTAILIKGSRSTHMDNVTEKIRIK